MVAHFQLQKTIGQGGYGSVELAIDTIKNTRVAIKFIVKDSDPTSLQHAMVANEMNAMIRVRSEHVARLRAFNKSTHYPKPDGSHIKTVMLVTEYCAGGNLLDNIMHAKRMNERLARTYFKQLIKGLEDCHKVGVLHRDIKAQNIMFDARCNLKIIDFGFAHLKQNSADLVAENYTFGTRGYQAPEILARTPTTGFSADIFSAGVLLFVMLAGYPPFEQALKTDQWFNPIHKNNYERFWQNHRGCPIKEDARPLIWRMLARDPEQRISIAAIKQTPWYNGEMMPVEELQATMVARERMCRAAQSRAARLNATAVRGGSDAHLLEPRRVTTYAHPPLQTNHYDFPPISFFGSKKFLYFVYTRETD